MPTLTLNDLENRLLEMNKTTSQRNVERIAASNANLEYAGATSDKRNELSVAELKKLQNQVDFFKKEKDAITRLDSDASGKIKEELEAAAAKFTASISEVETNMELIKEELRGVASLYYANAYRVANDSLVLAQKNSDISNELLNKAKAEQAQLCKCAAGAFVALAFAAGAALAASPVGFAVIAGIVAACIPAAAIATVAAVTYAGLGLLGAVGLFSGVYALYKYQEQTQDMSYDREIFGYKFGTQSKDTAAESSPSSSL